MRLFAAVALAILANAQTPPSGRSTIDEIRSHSEGLAIWWTGNAGWIIKHGNVAVGIDLDLSTTGKIQPPPVTADQLASELDLVFVTHHHGDHCNIATIRALAQGKRTTFVLPRTCLKRAAQLGIPEDRVIVPEPGKPFERHGIQVEPVHAIHGNQEFTVLTREADFVDSIRYNCGYVLSIGGKRFLHPGDSVLTEQHLGLKNIAVLFVSPTVHNMFTDRSMILINRLQPEWIFAQHFGTFIETDENRFWTKGYPDELKLRLSAELQKRFHKPRQGQMFVIH